MAKEQRLIDAEPVKKFIVDGLNNKEPNKAFGHDAIEILAEIEYAPAVDAVEVVRCKECKQADYSGCADGMVYCMEHSCYMNGNGYCSDGEREV